MRQLLIIAGAFAVLVVAAASGRSDHAAPDGPVMETPAQSYNAACLERVATGCRLQR